MLVSIASSTAEKLSLFLELLPAMLLTVCKSAAPVWFIGANTNGLFLAITHYLTSLGFNCVIEQVSFLTTWFFTPAKRS